MVSNETSPEELSRLCADLGREENNTTPTPTRPVVEQQVVVRVADEACRKADQSIAVVDRQFKFGIADVSITHTLGDHRGLLYCRKCSYYRSGRKLSYLRKECKKGVTKQQEE